MSLISKAAVIGGGVIGSGWAARFLLNGIDVAVFDPDPEIARKLDAVLANARRSWARLYPGVAFKPGTLSVAPSIAEAVAGAEFVQENLPEREDLKRRILKEIDALVPPGVVIGSSTSGLLPTRLQADMAHPERLVVGHPFNPVYLLPLVEVCGGDATSPETKRKAAAFYEKIGMKALVLGKEIDGFIADRLLEALWREALWLVNDGVATTAEIDDAVRYGAGLRWSFMGTFLIYRLAGGEDGMRHFLAQFGPALKLPWTKLEAPELTDELVDLVAAQSDDQAGDVSIRAYEALRDDCLVSVIAGLAARDYAAGGVAKAFHRELLARATPAGEALSLHRAQVPAEWLDYNGHMTEFRYHQVFSDATDALLFHVGADPGYVATGFSFYTAESHVVHLAEAAQGETLAVATQILGFDGKRLHLFHTIEREDDSAPLATAEVMLLHVDTGAGKVVPAEGPVRDALAALAGTHASLPRPSAAGRFVGAGR